MIHILVRVDVIFQEHLRLVIHLLIDVLEQETTDKSDAGKCDRGECRDLQPMSYSPFVRLRCSRNNFICLQ